MRHAREGISAVLAMLLWITPVVVSAETTVRQMAEGVTVSGEVPLRYGGVEISGLAAPGVFILAFWRGSVIGTTVATATGRFSLVLQGLPQAKNEIELGVVDGEGNASGKAVISPLIPVNSMTSTSGLLLPPTLSQSEARRWLTGELRGYAAPNTTISLALNGEPVAADIPVNERGEWSYLVAAKYRVGLIRISVVSRQSTGNTSAATDGILRVTPSGDVTQNGTVDTEDLSLMMYYYAWNVPLDDPREIDGTKPITSKDLRILLSQWTGIWK